MDIQITLVNRSSGCEGAQIVVYQKNLLGGIDEIPLVWKVLDCPPGHQVGFTYTDALAITANDEAENATALQPARPGQAYALRRSDAGCLLVPAGAASQRDRIEVLREQGEGPLGVRFHRGASVVASRQTLMPGTRAAFLFRPLLWLSVVPRASPGMLLPPAAQARATDVLSLETVRHTAVIHMTGSCTDPAQPLRFVLQAD